MDPLSLTASVIGVASAALAVSKKLYELAENIRNGHSELLRLAESIRNNATLLRCTVDLIEQHESLFKDQLKDVVRDINGQFDNITRLFQKLLPHKLARRRDKLRARAQGWWKSSKIQELTAQLFALGNTLSLILDVAHLAEIKLLRNQNELAIERSRIDASRAIGDCIQTVQWLKETEHHQLPPSCREMLAFDETARDMALWMAVILSAPGRKSRPMLPPHSSMLRGSSRAMRRHRQPEALPFGDLVRVVPEKQKIEGSSTVEAVFPAGDVDDMTLSIFNLPYRESVSLNGRKTLVVEAEDEVQIDMIVGMNAVLTLPNFEDFTIDTSPLMYLPKNVTLCRLLAEWTNMTNEQIIDTVHIESAKLENEDLEQDSSASEGSDRDASTYDNETTTSLDGPNDRVNDSRRSAKDQRWTSRVAFKNEAEPSYKPSPSLHRGLADRFSGTAFTPRTVETLDDDESLRDWNPGQRKPSGRRPGVEKRNQPRLTNRPVSSSRNTPRKIPSRPQYPQTGYPRMPPPPPEPYYPGFGPQQPHGQGFHPYQTGAYPAPPGPGPFYPPWPVPVPPTPPNPPPAPTPARQSTAAQKQPAFTDPVGDNNSEDLRATNISMRSSQVSMIPNDVGGSSRDQERNQMSGRESAKTAGRSNEAAAPEVGTAKDKEEELRARLKRELRAELMAEMTQEKLFAVQVYEDKHRERLEAYTHETTYEEMYQQAYHDLKRKQAEEEERVESLRQKIREEVRIELEGDERRRREEEELQERLCRATEEESSRRVREVEEQQRLETIKQRVLEEVRAEIEERERQSRQNDEMQGRVGRTMEAGEIEVTNNDEGSQCDVFSFIEELSFVSAGESETSRSITSGADDDDDDDDETQTTASSITKSYRNIERSRPWKGISHLGSCSEVVPFYIRGSRAGQTWYHGDEPIYIVEFAEDYNGAEEEGLSEGRRPYLLVDKLWVEAEALDKFGFRYAECPPSYYFLDPALTGEEIRVLVDFTFALREISNFKNRGLSCLSCPVSASDARLEVVGGAPPPPPLGFFGPVAEDRDVDRTTHVSPSQSSFDYVDGIREPRQALVEGNAREAHEELPVNAYIVETSEDGTGETELEEEATTAASNGFASNLSWVFGVLKFALHTIS